MSLGGWADPGAGGALVSGFWPQAPSAKSVWMRTPSFLRDFYRSYPGLQIFDAVFIVVVVGWRLVDPNWQHDGRIARRATVVALGIGYFLLSRWLYRRLRDLRNARRSSGD